MIDTWNPAKLNEKISGRDSWNPAILNEAVTDRDSWNPAILNESAGETPVVFKATITASFPEGATCTATDGTTTLIADDNPMAFSIPNSGTWTVACVANGVTFSEEVVINTDGQTETIDLTPVGDTYATTDSVPVLIACAGIGDSTYTTIAEVIADSELLTEITTNDNTIAYLVRSTTFAASITADEDAMTAIGASNECSDALLGNSTWLNAICNSTYFESVLNVKVPTMTSNTAPEGVASASSVDGANAAYKAFDNNSLTAWSTNSTSNQWVQYEFTSAKKAYAVKYNCTNALRTMKNGFVYAGNDANPANIVKTFTNNSSQSFTQPLTSVGTAYTTYRLHVTDVQTGGDSISVFDLQFYGRVDV